VSLAVRAITPIALVVAAYALFAGHNQPGGGFAAGLMLGAIVVLRTSLVSRSLATPRCGCRSAA
jgi:multisubunit Na+/H+ antiporter MnhB subunit